MENQVECELHGLETLVIYSKEQNAVKLYSDMLTIRLMEEYLENAYGEGKVRGFCHLVIGQEGLYAVLKHLIENDYLTSSYRCHGAGYAAGLSIKEIVCECLGTLDGNAKGKGGSMHLYNDKFFGGHGIVGAQVPLGAGIAFALKYKKFIKEDNEIGNKESFLKVKTDGVNFCIYGDGASNQGQIYETFNMAKVYNLPVVFIVENNQYGMYTPISNVSVDDCFYKRGYGIPGIRIRDTKIFDLQAVLQFAKNYAKASGPILVQIDTFRKCGHSTLDKTKFYMEKTVEEENKDKDSLLNLEEYIKRNMSKEDLNEAKKRVIEAFNKEISSIDIENMPGADELYNDLFYD
ncbi:alpha subunit of pyruvate dehydrogenase [Glugoides intestinalis]